jgi:outer membrane protein OmpA-like peptidoglycan-associated protein/Tol biopolymer transport system component
MQLFKRRAGVLFLLLTSVFFAPALFAQSGDALKHARAGFEYEQKQEYKLALYEYDAAIQIDPKYPYPLERIGGMYQALKNYPLAISFYQRAVKLDSNFDVYNYYNLGLSYRIVDKYDSAVWELKEFLNRMDPVNQADTLAMKDADFWIKFDLGCIVERAKPKNTENPLPLTDINSKYDDFGPSVTADGQTLYFTSRRPGTNTKEEIETNDYGDDVFVTHRDTVGPDSLRHWSKPTALSSPINSIDDEGAASISADGQTLYFSLCRRSDGVGDCDIYSSTLIGDQWTKPQNYGRPLNSPEWDAQPTVTADGSTMYFSSRRPGSIDGSEDIWVTYHNTDGSWTNPHNLGEPVNTKFNERSPFISTDGKTLYFSSNGHPGFGNHDLFMSKKLDDGTWSVPVNLGSPINDYGDDVFLTIPASGDKIIYASQRADARASLDLYEAKLPAQFRPGPVTLVAGTVYDKDTHLPVGAKIDVNDLKTDQLVAVYHANKVTGKFYITLGTGRMYGITADAKGYAPYSDNYTVPDTISYREVTHDLGLTPLPSDSIYANNGNGNGNGNLKGNLNGNAGNQGDLDGGNGKGNGGNGNGNGNGRGNGNGHGNGNGNGNGRGNGNGQGNGSGNGNANGQGNGNLNGNAGAYISDTIPLHNVFFDFNKATLRPESNTELRNLVDLLKKHPVFRIEIDGYTDSVGTMEYNLRLSQNRAKAVRQYIIQNGIAPKRVVTKGFGATQPVASNATDEGRQANRRTEFRFIR